MKKAGKEIILLEMKKVIWISIFVILLNGCGFYWWGNYYTYQKNIYHFWVKKPTSFIIKEYKIRAPYASENIGSDWSLFSGKGFKYAADCEVIFYILQHRLDEKGVFDFFIGLLKGEIPQGTLLYEDITKAVALYYDKGINVTPHFIEAFIEGNMLKRSDILRVLQKRKIKAHELAPYIEDMLRDEKIEKTSKGIAHQLKEYIYFLRNAN